MTSKLAKFNKDDDNKFVVITLAVGGSLLGIALFGAVIIFTIRRKSQ